MVFSAFRELVSRYTPFTEAELREMESRMVYREVPAKHCLLEMGAVCKEVYFINQGAMRFYYLTEDGKDVTGFIFLENMFATSHSSFLWQTPSEQVIETLEPCQLLVISFDDLQALYELVPRTNILMRKIQEERMSYAQRVVASFILNKPEDRYLALLARQPELLQRVPQIILSSYLGITPVSLSRIRRRLSEDEGPSGSR
jgi:CRP-like cAMP-binding protein